MKKVINYNNRINESAVKKNERSAKLYESVYDDIVEGAPELHNDKELAKVLQKAMDADKAIAFWAYAGNGIVNAIETILDDADINYTIYDGRRNFADFELDVNNGDVTEVVILNSFTRVSPDAIDDVLAAAAKCMEGDTYVIVVSDLDGARNEEYGDLMVGAFINYLYSPQYDRVSYYEKDEDDEDDIMDDFTNESVSQKFAKYRKLYESDEDDAPADDAPADDAPADDNKEDDAPADDAPADDNKEDDGETEDVPMTAILITVAKDDADKCKDEMVDAGVPEDGIEILDAEEDDENVKIRVDADYALELKEYLAGKGIDLEEKIGGEIVDDSENKEDDAKEDDDKKEDKDGDGDGAGDDDFLDDFFGADETPAE